MLTKIKNPLLSIAEKTQPYSSRDFMSLRITDSMKDYMSHRVGVFGRANLYKLYICNSSQFRDRPRK